MSDKDRFLLELAREGMRRADKDYIRWAQIERHAKVEGGSIFVGKAEERPVLHVVSVLTVTPNADGSFQVCVDQDRSFAVSPLLAALLRILAIDSGASDDDIVGWKSADSIVATIRATFGKKKFNRHALAQDIHRLRRTLVRNDLRILQTGRLSGAYRLALRRKPDSSNL